MGKQNRTMAESNYISMAKTDTWKARTAEQQSQGDWHRHGVV
jgi:hypothetical protein